MQVQRHTFTALNSTFIVDAEYEYTKDLGQGAYGCVVAAKHRGTGEGCAIKKITNINTKVRRLRVRTGPSLTALAAHIDQEVFAGDQVSVELLLHCSWLMSPGSCTTSAGTRTYVFPWSLL